MQKFIILGNGFDLHFSFKTSYKDFVDYLNVHYKSEKEYIESFNLFGDIEKDSLWMNFEEQLGSVNTDELGDYQYDIEETKALYCRLDDIKKELKKVFTAWINSIKCTIDKPINKDCFFNGDCFILNFNYTKTVERNFEITPTQIYHIHGISDGDIIFGHKPTNEINALMARYRNSYYDNEEDVIEYPPLYETSLHFTNEFVAGLEKPTAKMIKAMHAELSNREIDLSLVEEIMIIGYSYSEVDFPYFEWIADVCKNVRWKFGFYSNKDKVNAQKYIQDLKIQNFDIMNTDALMQELFEK